MQAQDEEPITATSESAVASLAEQTLGRPVALVSASERALQAARSRWDLAQFDLASSGRTRALRKAGGLLGAPLQAIRTPRHGIAVPAGSEYVLECFIDPAARADEGPFGEFTGYSSNRSTNNVFTAVSYTHLTLPTSDLV